MAIVSTLTKTHTYSSKIILFLLLGAMTTGTWAESEKSDTQSTINAGQTASEAQITLATVNGKSISRADLDTFSTLKQNTKPGQQLSAGELLQEMISREVLIQNATQLSVHQRPEFISEMASYHDNLLINTLLQEELAKQTITEEQIRKEYEEQISQMDLREYRARHILSETEQQAVEIIKTLDAGEDFAEIAKQRSTGPSATKGGDLGWFNNQTMVPAFAEAVQAMQKGTYTRKPVQTQFGWHVILLEDVREHQPPSFEQLKGQLQNILSNEALQDYVKTLRQKADIEIIQQP